MADVEKILKDTVSLLGALPFVDAVVLGGSRASGTATERSDIDIGIYYDAETIDYGALGEAAKALDDLHRDGLVCRAGEWGSWVNGGGWLRIGGIAVDWLLRDTARVKAVCDECDRGDAAAHYQTGHPHAYISAMYRGELAVSKILYAKNEDFAVFKKSAERYPDALREKLIGMFGFEMNFSLMLAEKALESGDPYYVGGHLFRSVSAMDQALFALNRTYCLNEKKAVRRIDGLKFRPERYGERVEAVFTSNQKTAVETLRALCAETEALLKQEG